jgi:hypothetical protein
LRLRSLEEQTGFLSVKSRRCIRRKVIGCVPCMEYSMWYYGNARGMMWYLRFSRIQLWRYRRLYVSSQSCRNFWTYCLNTIHQTPSSHHRRRHYSSDRPNFGFQVYMLRQTRVCIHTYIHTHIIHTYIRTYIHTYTHTFGLLTNIYLGILRYLLVYFGMSLKIAMIF